MGRTSTAYTLSVFAALYLDSKESKESKTVEGDFLVWGLEQRISFEPSSTPSTPSSEEHRHGNPTPLLLGSERQRRIDPERAANGDPVCEQGDGDEHQHSGGKRQRIDGTDTEHERAHQARARGGPG